MRYVWLLPLLGACGSSADPPHALDFPVHQIALSDTDALEVADTDAATNHDAGDIVATGYLDPTPVTTDGSGGMTTATSPLPPVLAAALGARHACGIVRGGDVWCWGDNTGGAVGAHRACPTTPTTDTNADGTAHAGCVLDPEIMPTLPKIRALAAGDDVTCALADADGAVYCWGTDVHGERGGSFVPALVTPTPVPLARPATALRIVHGTICAIDDAARAWCWGDGFGATPTALALTGVIDVALEPRHACAISDAGLTCWGENRNGESGDADAAELCPLSRASCPSGAIDLKLDATRVVIGERHACALLATGHVACWGSNEVGQLGRDDAFLVGKPELVDIPTAIDVVAAYSTTCAVDVDHTAWCWGQAKRADGSTQGAAE